MSAGQVGLSLAGLTVLYALLGAIDLWLLATYARKGPEPAPAAKEA